MDPNFTPGSDEYEQQLFQDQQDFLYSVLISSLKTDFSEALVKDHEGDTIPTRNGRELGEIWVSKVGTNF